MRRARFTHGGEVDFKLRRRAAWLKRLPQMVGKRAKSRPKLALRPERIYGRRSVIKASYVRNYSGRAWRNGLMEAHARYLERDHGHEGTVEPGFDATNERVSVSDTAHNWALAKDRLHWRIILSPEDVERIDLREHVRALMAQMEKDLGTKLRWVAIEHDNKEHRHAHILLRGVREEIDRNGKCVTLTMPREYVSQGIRDISQELIERQLGPRTEREYLQTRSNGIEAERWTEIDRTIERKLEEGVADYGFAAWLSDRSRPRVDQEMQRLAYLEGRGLAQSLGGDRWLVQADFKDKLLDWQRSNDIIKSRGRIHARQREQERELA